MSFTQAAYLSLMYIIPIGLIIFFMVRGRWREKYEEAHKGPSKKQISDQVNRLAMCLVKGHDEAAKEKYNELVQTIRTSLIMHSAGQTDAEAVLFVLKAAMLKLDGQSLTITTEEQKRAQRVIEGFTKLCRENGFRMR